MKPGKRRPIRWKQLRGIVRLIRSTRDVEMSCDDCYELLDSFADRHEEFSQKPMTEEEQKDLENNLKQVESHLSHCPHCRQEYNLLVKALSASKAASKQKDL